jgi:TatA/E family protein of Tat protein translocase
MNFAGIGAAELLVILIIALLIFGPKKLPEMAKDLGKTIGKWRRALEEIEDITDISGTLKSSSPSKEAEMQGAVQTVVKRKDKKNASGGEARAGEEKNEEAEAKTECQT